MDEKSRLDPERRFTDGEWIKLWKKRRRLGFRCLEVFHREVQAYGRGRPAIKLLCQVVRLNRQQIETIEKSGIANYRRLIRDSGVVIPTRSISG